MTVTRKILSVICAFLFAMSGVAGLLFFNIERKAFSAETYKQAFRQQGLYEDTAGFFVDSVMTSAQISNNLFSLLSTLSQEELDIVFSMILPQQELEAVTNSFLDSLFTFVDGKTDSVTISLVTIKQNMAGEGGVQAITLFIQAQPDCTPAQLLQMGIGVLSSNEGITLCRPPDEMMGLVTPLIETQLQFITNGIPDELTVVTTGQTGSSHDFRPQLNRIRMVMKLSLVLPFVFLAAITLLAVRKMDEWLKWWGIPFLITGILGTLTALVAAPIIPVLIETWFSRGGINMPIEILSLVQKTAGSITGEIVRPIAIQGILLTLTGSAMAFVNVIMNRNKSNPRAV